MTTKSVRRDVMGEFVSAYGGTRIAALRQIYGTSFATGVDGRKTLSEVADTLDRASLERLARDYDTGRLAYPRAG